MTTFIALYRGDSIGAAKMVAVSADPFLVASASKAMLADYSRDEETKDDPVLNAVQQGKVTALHLIQGEATEQI